MKSGGGGGGGGRKTEFHIQYKKSIGGGGGGGDGDGDVDFKPISNKRQVTLRWPEAVGASKNRLRWLTLKSGKN